MVHSFYNEISNIFSNVRIALAARTFITSVLLYFCLGSISSAGAAPLQAGVEFSHKLAPLKSGLREGQRMNLEAVETKNEITEWRRIPKWFAGVWHREKTVRKSGQSYQTRADMITGYQADAKGRVWQPVFFRVRKVDAGPYIEYQIPQRKTIFKVDKGSLTSFSQSTRIRISKATGRIVQSFQQEDMSVSEPIEDGLVRATVECRVFSQDGTVELEDTIECEEERIEPFTPIDEFSGTNYRESFIKFLEASGHPELVPTSRPLVAVTPTQSRILRGENRDTKLLDNDSKTAAGSRNAD